MTPTNPYLRALLVIASLLLLAAGIFGLVGLQQSETYSAIYGGEDGGVPLAWATWLGNLGGVSLFVWLLGAAVTWRPERSSAATNDHAA